MKDFGDFWDGVNAHPVKQQRLLEKHIGVNVTGAPQREIISYKSAVEAVIAKCTEMNLRCLKLRVCANDLGGTRSRMRTRTTRTGTRRRRRTERKSGKGIGEER